MVVNTRDRVQDTLVTSGWQWVMQWIKQHPYSHISLQIRDGQPYAVITSDGKIIPIASLTGDRK